MTLHTCSVDMEFFLIYRYIYNVQQEVADGVEVYPIYF